jgi:hypothetical protein
LNELAYSRVRETKKDAEGFVAQAKASIAELGEDED